jgi:hypothetical protein
VTQSGDLEAANKLKALIEDGATKPAPITAKKSPTSSGLAMTESPEEDFEVRFSGETAEIAKYIGKSDIVRVPAVIQGAKVVNIGANAFEKCDKIKEVILPNTITSISRRAFQGAGLIKVNIPDSVNSIGGRVFGCPFLKELTIPAGVRLMDGPPTDHCKALEKIQVDPANENFASVDGVLYDKQISTLLNVPAGFKNKNLKVPNTVKMIGDLAFRGCEQLKTIQIPKDTQIGPNAFFDAQHIRVIRY